MDRLEPQAPSCSGLRLIKTVEPVGATFFTTSTHVVALAVADDLVDIQFAARRLSGEMLILG